MWGDIQILHQYTIHQTFTFYSWNSTVRKNFSFICLLIHSFISIRWSYGFLFYSLSFNPIFSSFIYLFIFIFIFFHHLFWCCSCPRFGQCELLQADFFILLACPYHSLGISLLSVTARWFRLIFFFPCPSLTITHSSKASWLLLVQEVFKSQNLGIWCAHCYIYL